MAPRCQFDGALEPQSEVIPPVDGLNPRCPQDELAWFAFLLFNIDVDPPAMLSIEKKRKEVQVKSV